MTMLDKIGEALLPGAIVGKDATPDSMKRARDAAIRALRVLIGDTDFIFNIGDRTQYGRIVAAYANIDGQTRYVCEDAEGKCMVCGTDRIELQP